MVSFLEIMVYLTLIAVSTLMAVIGDRLGLAELPSKKVKLSRDAPVTKIKGIKSEHAKELSKHKIRTVDDLVKAKSKNLAKAKGLTRKEVKKWQKYALKAMMED